jgi:hypothetical protein
VGGRAPRAALILVDDLDGGERPAERDGPLPERVLALGALLMLADLEVGRLAYVHAGEALPVRARDGRSDHGGRPLGSRPGSGATPARSTTRAAPPALPLATRGESVAAAQGSKRLPGVAPPTRAAAVGSAATRPRRHGRPARAGPAAGGGRRGRRRDRSSAAPPTRLEARRWHRKRASACKAAGDSSGAATSPRPDAAPTGAGRSVALQGTAKARPLWLRTSTHGAPTRQKTRATRPTCPQCALSSAVTVSRAPLNAPCGAVCCGAKGHDVRG